jgi:hypothetical protein
MEKPPSEPLTVESGRRAKSTHQPTMPQLRLNALETAQPKHPL